MKQVFSILVLLLAFGYSFGQENWQKYTTEGGVEIYTQEVDCHARNIPDQVAVLVKVNNTNTQRVKVEWDLYIWYNDEPSTNNVADGENHYVIELEASGEIEGTCDTPYGALYIYKDFITYKTDTKMTKFELRNIKITLL